MWEEVSFSLAGFYKRKGGFKLYSLTCSSTSAEPTEETSTFLLAVANSTEEDLETNRMRTELRKWRSQQSRYFADPDAVPPPEVQAAFSEAAKTRRNNVTCYSCFGEGHEASSCPQSGIRCSSCGGSGHKADECPVYLMELSIRGTLTAYVRQRKEKATAAVTKTVGKGSFPALDPCQINSSTSSKNSKESPDFSAIQCIVCGRLGHANCGATPLTHWIAYCPRCAQLGHTGAGCTGSHRACEVNRLSLLDQIVAGDPWKHPAERGSTSGRGGRDTKPSPALLLHKPKSSWQKRRKASASIAAAADPWHPSHLRVLGEPNAVDDCMICVRLDEFNLFAKEVYIPAYRVISNIRYLWQRCNRVSPTTLKARRMSRSKQPRPSQGLGRHLTQSCPLHPGCNCTVSILLEGGWSLIHLQKYRFKTLVQLPMKAVTVQPNMIGNDTCIVGWWDTRARKPTKCSISSIGLSTYRGKDFSALNPCR